MDALQLPKQDNTAKTLIISLLLVTIGCWLTMIWSTYRTYQEAPPIPKIMQSVGGQVIMTAEDLVEGKAGFQKADLMDYGSLYGMGSYFGEDYTAQYLVELGQEVMSLLAHKQHSNTLEQLSESDRFGVQREMQKLSCQRPPTIARHSRLTARRVIKTARKICQRQCRNFTVTRPGISEVRRDSIRVRQLRRTDHRCRSPLAFRTGNREQAVRRNAQSIGIA